MKIKVCGITSVEQLRSLYEMDIDYAGLIFVKSSPRYAFDKLSLQKHEVRKSEISKAGVFVNENMDIIKQRINEFGLSLVQLHGDEDATFTAELNKIIPVMKAIRISEQMAVTEQISQYEGMCSYLLFDTHSDAYYGGTGKSFPWNKLPVQMKTPFFLSGGISASHVDALKNFHHPNFFALDINSKFEKEPGIKDLEMVSSFKKQLDQKHQ